MQHTQKAKFFSWYQVFRGVSLNTLFFMPFENKVIRILAPKSDAR